MKIFPRKIYKENLNDSYIDIETNLSVDEVITRLRQITINTSEPGQTTYQQRFSGQVNQEGTKITPIEDTPRTKTVYEIKFIVVNSKTNIRISNNVFEKRQLIRGLLIGLCMPFGFIILILGIIFMDNSELLPVALCMALILIVPGFLYKAKTLTVEEYKNDEYINIITKHLTS